MPQSAIVLTVRVRPGARETAITGTLADGSLKIDVAGRPEDGEANAELTRFLARHFGVPAAHVRIVSGAGARRKLIRIERGVIG